MSAGSIAKFRQHYTPLEAGTEFCHVYPTIYAPCAFNPSSRNRFAIPAPPDRGMFYAGDSSACALWETILRDLVVEASKPQSIDPALLEGRSIAKLTLTQEVLV